jgi:hypothetical protein
VRARTATASVAASIGTIVRFAAGASIVRLYPRQRSTAIPVLFVTSPRWLGNAWRRDRNAVRCGETPGTTTARDPRVGAGDSERRTRVASTNSAGLEESLPSP